VCVCVLDKMPTPQKEAPAAAGLCCASRSKGKGATMRSVHEGEGKNWREAFCSWCYEETVHYHIAQVCCNPLGLTVTDLKVTRPYQTVCVEFCLYPRRSRGCAMRAKAERQRVQHRAIAWRGSRAR